MPSVLLCQCTRENELAEDTKLQALVKHRVNELQDNEINAFFIFWFWHEGYQNEGERRVLDLVEAKAHINYILPGCVSPPIPELARSVN